MRIWVDCTAAAHPLVLRPIIERLRERGHEVEITAREYGQTVGILERLGLEHEVVGRHGGGATAGKGLALARRSWALAGWARGRGFELALAHGSVDLAVVSTALRIRSVQMQDYEYAGLQRQLAFRAASRVLVPDAIPVEAMRRAGAQPGKLVPLPGAQGGLLPRGLRRGRDGPGRAGGRPRPRARGRPPAARDFRLSRRATRSTRRCSIGSPPTSGASRS